MDRNEAAIEFAKVLFQQGVISTIEAINDIIESPDQFKGEAWGDVRRLVTQLDSAQASALSYLVRRTAIMSTHQIACQLDGVTEYHYVDDQPVEFVLSMRRGDIEDSIDEQVELIQICPTESGYEVHDLLMELVDSAGLRQMDQSETN